MHFENKEQLRQSMIIFNRNAFESSVSNVRTLSNVCKNMHPFLCIYHLCSHFACPVTSHYLNQCWYFVNWTPGNKIQWNLNRKFIICIQENAFENVGCQIGSHFVQGELSLTHGTKPKQTTTNLTWWCHDMETLSALLTPCEGNPSVLSGSLIKGQLCVILAFLKIAQAWTNQRSMTPKSALRTWVACSCGTNIQVVGDSVRHDAYVTSL